MYIPKAHLNENASESFTLIRKNPLATVITCHAQGPYISHLPLILEVEEDRMVLYGHLARANPHADLLARASVTAIFMGPQSYITPTWYAEDDVPTWNYMTVHARGTAEMIEDYNGVVDCLQRLTHFMESSRPAPWEFYIPEDLQQDNLAKHIVGFKIEIEKIESKFKLSLNRSADDIDGIIAGLALQGDEISQTMRAEIQKRRKSSKT